MLKMGLWAGVLYGGYRMFQAAGDIEFRTRALPKWGREGLKAKHILEHGPFCPCCREYTSFAEFVIDHRVPYSRGGRTSFANSRSICRTCNGAKGVQMDFSDWLRGRGGRRDTA